MSTMAAVIIGVLVAGAVYSLLQRSIVRIVVGIVLLSQAVNLTVFSAAGLREATPPVIADGARTLAAGAADPLPQALVLTAIVIGFGLVAFTLALTTRTYQELGDDDIEKFKRTDT
jgi:multicomponent Na+:H+ antiporter subunit C